MPVLVGAQEDNSGTNPIALTNDFRMIYELQSWPGDNSYSMTTFQFRAPLMKNLQFQLKVPIVTMSLGSAPNTYTASGTGDLSARLLTIPYVSQKFALALGLEGFFSTASQPDLGTNRNALGPQVFGVVFNPLGIKGSLIAPAVQQKITIDDESDGPDINQTLIDLYMVWLAPSKKNWFILDPAMIIDHEQEIEFAQVELEIGQMMFGPTSSYVRPGIGVGSDRPLDWNFEMGFKVIWK